MRLKQNFLEKWQADCADSHDSYVITLVSAKFELANLSRVNDMLAQIAPATRIIFQQTLQTEFDWQINSNLGQAEQTSPVSILQWLVEGNVPPDFARQVKKQLSGVKFGLDSHVMPLATLLHPRKLAVFDMDSTLIEQETLVELAKKIGIGEQMVIITEATMRGEIDFTESFTRRVGLLKGLPKTVLDDIIRDNITFSLGAKRLITALKNHGYHVVLVSGGFTYFAEFVKKELGMDEVFANDLDIVDGKLTGQVISPIIDGKRKAEILQDVANRLKLDLSQTVAVGDGANDLPMLDLAGIGIAYRAKPIVQEQAEFAINVAGLDGVMAVLGLT